ncbi:class I SAM-dependent methyltransferase [Paenibacillus rhizophilus]|uniref:SAM-dependent methyltransferase n=1 Tax=Paenibacillus rhizophilus TaxID=1850366 RepID=A0A3N9PAI6_9BACL|nr:class I SAM-dependent methyltransferase [Paenibacillus rhizophilus]RQW13258.1 SAM-dependent methyltransferase [Paenibacillus rhizophilus]
MIITTGDRPLTEVAARAERLAERLGVPYAPRGNQSMSKLLSRYGDEEALVVLLQGVRLLRPDRPQLQFHPSMGFVRAKRVLKGESDPMLEAAGMVPGDSVLDCTAGLGADALLFAVHGGERSSVTALESSLPLYALLTEGMAHYASGLVEVDAALRRINVVHSNHLDYLRSLPDNSVDIVYFDPMFREPLEDSAGISPLRAYANSDSLSAESVSEAVRAARKAVVLKEKRGSGEFGRLGFAELLRPGTKTSYGVITIDQRS